MGFRITGETALAQLQRKYDFSEAQARRILNIAWEHEEDAEPVPGGLIRITYHGLSETTAAPRPHIYSISEDIGPARKRGLAEDSESEYPKSKTTSQRREPRKKGHEMARTAAAQPTTGRGRRPAPKPDPEPEQNGALDVQRFLTKPFTATMQDYVEWFETEVTPLADLRRDLPRILVLGVQLYGPYFQKSDFNVSRREERRAERASAAAPEPAQAARPARGRKAATATTEPATGTSRGRGRKPAAAKDEPPAPARRGRPPKAAADTAKPAATKPAATTGRGRGRGRTPQAAGKDAPF